MNCPNCGFENPEGSAACASCGQAFVAAPPAPPIPPAAPPAPPAQPAPPAAPPAPPAQPVAYAPQPVQQYAPQPGGYAQPQVVAAVPVKNHLVMAILATLFCCVPFGAVGIIFAAQVNSKLVQGDFAGAQKASKAALTWSWVAIGSGALGGILYAVLMVVGVLSEAASF